MVDKAAETYRKYHTAKSDERLGLFEGLVKRYGVSRALYPGSFVHVTPSFVIPEVVYVDSDKRAAAFFSDPGTMAMVRDRRTYEAEPVIRFHHQDYGKPIPEPDSSFDLLISQYAGFVSRDCGRHLRVGGYLVVNNSHGDASMARLDPGFELVAVYRRHGERFTFSSEELETYMIPKSGIEPDRLTLEREMRGPAFSRQVAGYVFRRTAEVHASAPGETRLATIPGASVTLRPARDADRRDVFRWLAESDVTSSMLGPPLFLELPAPTWEEFNLDYGPNFFDGSTLETESSYIIEAEGEPVGQINYEIWDSPVRLAELDIWLRSQADTGRGYGPDALVTLTDHLFRAFGVDTFLIRPSARNPRAIRAYQKAGFELQPMTLQEHVDTYGAGDYEDTVVMIKRDVGGHRP